MESERTVYVVLFRTQDCTMVWAVFDNQAAADACAERCHKEMMGAPFVVEEYGLFSTPEEAADGK